jgi:hypothetical protein
MPVVVNEASATIKADHKGARPGVDYTTRGPLDVAVFHQGRNSQAIVAGNIDYEKASAIKLIASVFVTADKLVDIQNQYAFHFMQLVTKSVDYTLYAGKTPSEGSLRMDFAAPTLFPRDELLLDTEQQDFPWSENNAAKNSATIVSAGPPGIWIVLLQLDDHPFADRPLSTPNPNVPGGDKQNYLYEAARTLTLFATFVVKNRITNVIKPLGFVKWQSRIQARIRWRDAPGGPIASEAQVVLADFNVGDFIQGAPNPDAEDLLTHPPEDWKESFRAVEDVALRDIYLSSANTPNYQASDTWSVLVPATHFKP